MPKSGLFITLYDEDTLKLYLDRDVYGFLMPPIYGEVSSQSRHHHALADYACARAGTHVFFFLKRKIVYGGEIIGSNDYGAFHINGSYSLLGREINAPLCWDESTRARYQPTSRSGIFTIPNKDGEYCQPYLIRFRDRLGIKGNVISSDQLYWELGQYPYPLPTNTISNMGFCTMTPGEVDIALRLLNNNSIDSYDTHSQENIAMQGEPKAFEPRYSFTSIRDAFSRSLLVSEAHLEAFVLANPNLLPEELRPPAGTTLCRQVPMSPYKPAKYLDKANICYYSSPYIKDGTLPNTIIELKTDRVSKANVEQVAKYLRWLYVILKDQAAQIRVYLCGPSFSRIAERYLPHEYQQQVSFIALT